MEGMMARLSTLLGYNGNAGLIGNGDLSKVDPSSRAVVHQAFRDCGVETVFGLKGHHGGTAFVPLVYLATAADNEAAKEAHSAMWTQGTAPFALIVTPAGVWYCDIFLPPSASSSRTFVPEVDFPDAAGASPPDVLAHLTSLNLRVSLSRPPTQASRRGRVDARLLDNLRALTNRIIPSATDDPVAQRKVANALIGRLLFMRFLRDQGRLPADWIPALPGRGKERAAWLELFWQGLTRADEAFNGSAFPISPTDRAQIRPDHAAAAFDVIIQDADLRDGKIQLGFSEFRFATLRTETLSAVYELFLELTDNGQKVEDGAVYTPPFLADHVLQKVARERPFASTDRVLDCAAGSGIFLVGAFRRILEAALEPGKRTLPLKTLHRIVRRSIWGIELNPEACQVAALSLYLTMLDYADPKDVDNIVARRPSRRKVFPELVGRNILTRNFFDYSPMPAGFPSKFEFIVANPPWITLADAGAAAMDYADKHESSFTDRKRAAPAFLHKALTEHARKDGAFGFVMSARALVSSAAKHFPAYLASQTGLSACSNLSNLRRSLFLNAEHPAIVLVGRPERDASAETLSIFHPSQVTQPIARDSRHWILVEDRAEQRVYRRDLIRGAEDLINALTLSPADYRFSEWMAATRRSRSLATLGDALEANGLRFSRGGEPYETGIPDEYILNAKKDSPRYYADALRQKASLVPSIGYELPRDVIARARGRYRQTFAGNIVLFARNASDAVFVRQPIAFNSSFYGIYAAKGSNVATEYMEDLADYLSSKFSTYCFSVIGRDWALDERRLEKEQIVKLPIPQSFVRNARTGVRSWVRGNFEELTKELRLPAFVVPVASEFSSYKQSLQNARRPPDAMDAVTDTQRKVYEEALAAELRRYVTTTSEYAVRSSLRQDAGIGIVAARHLSGPVETSRRTEALRAMERELAPAADRFSMSQADLISSSSCLQREGPSVITIVKPLPRPYWTVERALGDAELIIEDAMSRALEIAP